MGDSDESALRWLHLSDLLIGTRGNSLLVQKEFRNAFERDLADIHDDTGPWDFVVITGNVALGGETREYELASLILGELWSFFESLGSRPAALVVPGEHDDVHRDITRAQRTALVESWATEVALRDRFEPFLTWRANWERSRYDTLPRVPLASEGDFGLSFRRGRLRVEIVGLNTERGEDDVTREALIAEAQLDAVASRSTGADAVLVVSHRAPSRWEGGAVRLRQKLGETPIVALAAPRRHGETSPGPLLDTVVLEGLRLENETSKVDCGYTAGRLRLGQGRLMLLHTRVRTWNAKRRRFDELPMVAPVHAIGRLWPEASDTATGMRGLPSMSDVSRSGDRLDGRAGRPSIGGPPATPGGDSIATPGLAPRAMSETQRVSSNLSADGVWCATAQGNAIQLIEGGVQRATLSVDRDVIALSISPGGTWLLVATAEHFGLVRARSGVWHRPFTMVPKAGGRIVWADDALFAVDTERTVAVSMIDAAGMMMVVHVVSPSLARILAGSRAAKAVAVARPDAVMSLTATQALTAPLAGVEHLVWSPDGAWLAAAHGAAVTVFNQRLARQALLEGFVSGEIAGLTFSDDGRILTATTARGESVGWLVGNWGAALVGDAPRPATRTAEARSVTAKVVLLGEANAGKSSLAMRLTQGRFEELGATHAMRVWPVTIGALDPEHQVPADERREVVFWDMGGQDEYRLLHRTFLHDTLVAIFVIEPRRGAVAFEELTAWRAHVPEAGVASLLVASKLDDAAAPRDAARAQALVADQTFRDYLETSARTPLGIEALGAAIVRAIDWSRVGVVVRTATFQRVLDYINVRRESGRLVLPYHELEDLIRTREATMDRRAIDEAVAHLAREGRIADLRLAEGTRMLVLEVEQVHRYAASLIIAARDNPRGVPALDSATVTAPGMEFPRIPAEQRLKRDQEVVVLEAVITMLIEHGICFRSGGMLVFPSLFRDREGPVPVTLGASTRFDFTGVVDKVYAALVSWLAMNRSFGPVRLWKEAAEFASETGLCGVRCAGTQIQRRRGEGRLELFFDTETSPEIRQMFVRVAEDFLVGLGVEIVERPDVVCACGRGFAPEDVRERLDDGKLDIGCVCDRRTPLLPPLEPGDLGQRLRAFRTETEQRRSRVVSEAQADLSNARKEHSMAGPVRILHLSDLHIGASDDIPSLIQPLIADLRDAGDGLGERLDYIVISGDLTNVASPAELANARAFVETLIARTSVSAERCVIVPGNHDLSWNVPSYDWVPRRNVPAFDPVLHVEQGAGYLVRNAASYPQRFAAFSEHFFHPLFQRPYDLEAAQQGGAILFDEHALQFLTFNSAWHIDEWFPERSGLHPGAVSRTLMEADQAVQASRDAGRLANGARVLRLAVWHHPLTGNEKIVDDAFAENLRKAGITACLHGHVHEDRAELVGYQHPRHLYVVGAGSFGAPAKHRPESTPQLYNVLEIAPDRRAIKVHTRAKRRGPGAWAPWAVWHGAGPGDRRAWYEIPI